MKRTEWYPIPDCPGYMLSNTGDVKKITHTKLGTIEKRLQVYQGITGKYVTMYLNGQAVQMRIFELKRNVSENKAVLPYITRTMTEGRAPLTKERVYSHILRFMPDVQVKITPNADGKYEMGRGMKEKGIIVCPDCGHIQAVETRECKNCNEYIL